MLIVVGFFFVLFPMGKVKLCEDAIGWLKQIVSIPYGKGKDIQLTQINQVLKNAYQFPMGKVKCLQNMLLQHVLLGINSLWERLRCCPRAKRLGNSTHATALREDEPQGEYFASDKLVGKVSIPYGKGKVDVAKSLAKKQDGKYQFPMGKVKTIAT